jgi:2-phospho-L-lactate guanylyltransferase (CobY/MobA/RfbA family)
VIRPVNECRIVPRVNVLRPGPPRCVLLFARAPRAEAAAKGLGGGEGLFALARDRVVRAVADLPGVDLVVVPPASQSGGDFGARLEGAFREAARRGYREIVAVPGDVPELTARDLDSAFHALEETDTVLGPSPDGGVWLIGLDAREVAFSDSFERVPWRTRRVFETLVENAPNAAILREHLDVDRRADARRLSDAVRTARTAFDHELFAALGTLLGASSPSRRAAEPETVSLPPLAHQPASRAPPFPPLPF